MKYINFTTEEKERARHTDIAELLRSQGEVLKRSGSEYQWKTGSDKVTVRGNVWFNQYQQQGGDTIDFVMKYFNLNYVDTVKFLLERNGAIITHNDIQRKAFALPKANQTLTKVLSYLIFERGIDKDVLNEFIQAKMIYESADYHNAVFVGYDTNEIPKHAHKRGTSLISSYKGNVAGSVPEYSFHWFGNSDKLFLFEAPIDMLSFISMNKENWKNNSYAASCSVSDRVLFQCLKDNPNIKSVYLCFDNDEAGQTANHRISHKLNDMNIQNKILIPDNKDWNEEILFP